MQFHYAIQVENTRIPEASSALPLLLLILVTQVFWNYDIERLKELRNRKTPVITSNAQKIVSIPHYYGSHNTIYFYTFLLI